MKFDVLNRWSGNVQFSAEIECPENTATSIRLGLAVRWAVKTRADLTGAVLTGADLAGAVLAGAVLTRAVLTGADLTGADLTDAVLTGADLARADLTDAVLTGADLTGAVLTEADLTGAVLTGAKNLSGGALRSFKADLWLTLAQNRNEVPGLIQALCEGRVDGSVYEGECACLVGTIGNLRGVSIMTLDHDARRPAERWFAMIRAGDKPGDEGGGGFAAKMALEWALEWCAVSGVTVKTATEGLSRP